MTCKIVFGTIPDSSRSYDLQNGAPSTDQVLLPLMGAVNCDRNLLHPVSAMATPWQNGPCGMIWGRKSSEVSCLVPLAFLKDSEKSESNAPLSSFVACVVVK